MEEKKSKCPACGTMTTCYPEYESLMAYYRCPICGQFEFQYPIEELKINRNHLSSYLFYNRFDADDSGEARYHTTLDREKCDQYRKEYDEGTGEQGRPIHMDAEIIESWYPKTFAERVDKILVYLGNHTPHIGQGIYCSLDELASLLFVDRWEYKKSWNLREYEDYSDELDFMINYLSDQDYINNYSQYDDHDNKMLGFTLKPKGYARIDELQKNTSYGRDVLVAMKFGDDTKNLREAIRMGITSAGYHAVLIDEVEHNGFITPELLKHIRDSKFVVVDLTHQNNGAYFEEGYAMGLGKPVIQLCKKDIKLHFDIAQKNTIFWASEIEIPERLCNRIKATIE